MLLGVHSVLDLVLDEKRDVFPTSKRMQRLRSKKVFHPNLSSSSVAWKAALSTPNFAYCLILRMWSDTYADAEEVVILALYESVEELK